MKLKIKSNNKHIDNKIFNIQSEKADLERHVLIEGEKYRDLIDRYNAKEVLQEFQI